MFDFVLENKESKKENKRIFDKNNLNHLLT
jgi:hypothetical protein